METKYKFFIACVIICVALIAIIEPRSKRRLKQHLTTFILQVSMGKLIQSELLIEL
jgi:hypothetical protein